MDDITFCRAQCGKNMHVKCMKDWQRAHVNPIACPLCRDPWKEEDSGVIEIAQDLDREALQLYISWLYSGELNLSDKLAGPHEEFNILLLKAYRVAMHLADEEFEFAIAAEFISSVESKRNPGFGNRSIELAFDPRYTSEKIQLFMVYAVLAYMDIKDFTKYVLRNSFPADFIRYLCMLAMVSSRDDPGSKASLLKEATGGEYELEVD